MKEFKVSIPTVQNVKEFVQFCSTAPFAIDVTSGTHTVDGKSLMGIFSLNLSNAVTVICKCDSTNEKDNESLEKFEALIKPFIEE